MSDGKEGRKDDREIFFMGENIIPDGGEEAKWKELHDVH